MNKIVKHMNNIILPFILILLMIGCKPYSESTDYFGQNPPGSIPVVFAPGTVSVQGRLEHGISFTPDTRELAFGILNQEDFSGEIFYAKKMNEKWTEPVVRPRLQRRPECRAGSGAWRRWRLRSRSDCSRSRAR